MRKFFSLIISAAVLTSWAGLSFAADKVKLGINWVAQPSFGGFYQAIADGTYEKYGIEVEVVTGGAQVNLRPMLPAGRLDFMLGIDLFTGFDNYRENVPTMAVAAFNVKSPMGLLTHKGAYKDFADLTNAPGIAVSRGFQITGWRWMVKEKNFKDEQLRPFTFGLGQFLADKKYVQQTYTNVVPTREEAGGAEVEVFSLADNGYDTYAQTLYTRNEIIEKNPDLVQRFVDASIEGWYTFLYGDNSKGVELIKKSNPDITQARFDSEFKLQKELGIVDSGETLTKGIGSIDIERVNRFVDSVVSIGMYPKGSLDVSKIVTDKFVNKGVGLNIKNAAK